uniref:Uncharacterized protein n=1 Tax=Arundo donax TaxID=35708 RepID=A0A0A9F4I5_ARUDO
MAPRMPWSTGSWGSRRTGPSMRRGRGDWRTSARSRSMAAGGLARTSCSSACRASCARGRSCSRSRLSCVRRPSRTPRSSRRSAATRRLPRSMLQLPRSSRINYMSGNSTFLS